MNVIFKSWELTTENPASSYGQPVLVERATGTAYGSADIVTCYPSWGPLLARDAVRRMATTATLDDEQRALVDKFCGLLKG